MIYIMWSITGLLGKVIDKLRGNVPTRRVDPKRDFQQSSARMKMLVSNEDCRISPWESQSVA